MTFREIEDSHVNKSPLSQSIPTQINKSHSKIIDAKLLVDSMVLSKNGNKNSEIRGHSGSMKKSHKLNIVLSRSRGNPRLNDVTVNCDVLGVTVQPCKIQNEKQLVTWKQIASNQTLTVPINQSDITPIKLDNYQSIKNIDDVETWFDNNENLDETYLIKELIDDPVDFEFLDEEKNNLESLIEFGADISRTSTPMVFDGGNSGRDAGIGGGGDNQETLISQEHVADARQEYFEIKIEDKNCPVDDRGEKEEIDEKETIGADLQGEEAREDEKNLMKNSIDGEKKCLINEEQILKENDKEILKIDKEVEENDEKNLKIDKVEENSQDNLKINKEVEENDGKDLKIDKVEEKAPQNFVKLNLTMDNFEGKKIINRRNKNIVNYSDSCESLKFTDRDNNYTDTIPMTTDSLDSDRSHDNRLRRKLKKKMNYLRDSTDTLVSSIEIEKNQITPKSNEITEIKINPSHEIEAIHMPPLSSILINRRKSNRLINLEQAIKNSKGRVYQAHRRMDLLKIEQNKNSKPCLFPPIKIHQRYTIFLCKYL